MIYIIFTFIAIVIAILFFKQRQSDTAVNVLTMMTLNLLDRIEDCQKIVLGDEVYASLYGEDDPDFDEVDES